jgi:type II secretory pathway pseudopilin PulG
MRYNRRKQNGFTLIELLLAAFLGFVVTMSIYLVFIGTTRQYAVQEQIVAMHESMRFAVDFLKLEIKGAGRLAVVNGRLKDGAAGALGVRDPLFCPTRKGVQAFELFENDNSIPNILSGAPNGLKPDRLRLLKDAPGAAPLVIERIQGRTLKLEGVDGQRTKATRALAKSEKRMQRIFMPGHYVYILSRTGLSDLLPITDFNFGASSSSVDLVEQPCDLGGRSLISQCTFGGCVAVPVQLIEYRVELEPDSDTLTRLVRHIKDARQPEEDLGSQGLILASQIIDFQVMGLADLRTREQIELVNSGQNTQPIITPDDDPRDDRGNATGDSEAEALNVRPEAIRSVKVVLAARTLREDSRFRLAIDQTVASDARQPTERTWFELDTLADTGYARVTTLSFEVETPNLYRGQ